MVRGPLQPCPAAPPCLIAPDLPRTLQQWGQCFGVLCCRTPGPLRATRCVRTWERDSVASPRGAHSAEDCRGSRPLDVKKTAGATRGSRRAHHGGQCKCWATLPQDPGHRGGRQEEVWFKRATQRSQCRPASLGRRRQQRRLVGLGGAAQGLCRTMGVSLGAGMQILLPQGSCSDKTSMAVLLGVESGCADTQDE